MTVNSEADRAGRMHDVNQQLRRIRAHAGANFGERLAEHRAWRALPESAGRYWPVGVALDEPVLTYELVRGELRRLSVAPIRTPRRRTLVAAWS